MSTGLKKTAEEVESNAIVEKITDNKKKKILKSIPLQQTQPQGPKIIDRLGQPNNNRDVILEPRKEAAKVNKDIDEESKKGRFGWVELDQQFVPYIFRYTTDKFLSVRMVKEKMTRLLQTLPPEVISCTCISSYYVTEAEAKLLNEIITEHVDKNEFGKEKFSSKDLLVIMEDVKELYNFLELCYKKVVLKNSKSYVDRCGLLKIDESFVPYTIINNLKFVPLFCFEGETDELKLASQEISGWDLAYIKFCCKVQKIRNELFDKETCKIVGLEVIKSHFSEETTYEYYWPAKGGIEPVPVKNAISMTFQSQTWTQKPAFQLSKQEQASTRVYQQKQANQHKVLLLPDQQFQPPQSQSYKHVLTSQLYKPIQPCPQIHSEQTQPY